METVCSASPAINALGLLALTFLKQVAFLFSTKVSSSTFDDTSFQSNESRHVASDSANKISSWHQYISFIFNNDKTYSIDNWKTLCKDLKQINCSVHFILVSKEVEFKSNLEMAYAIKNLSESLVDLSLLASCWI
jgi:hypothetical protein